MTEWTIDKLVGFESKIADLFNNGEIKAPVHLSDGSEAAVIDVFKDIRSEVIIKPY